MFTVQAGDRQYELVEGWGELPDGWKWGQVAGVACDSQDNVHVYTRADHPYLVFDKSGKLLDHWGKGELGMAHSLFINDQDDVFVLSHHEHYLFQMTKGRDILLTLGTRGQPSDTGYTKEGRVPFSPRASGGGIPVTNGVAYPGGPFHQPTSVVQDTNGDIFVSDGYRNARVHRFAKDGTLIKSWGEVGHAQELRNTTNKPGCFHTPHGVWVHDGKVYLLDRENNRIQIFTTDGDFLTMWTGFERPTDIYMDKDGVFYVTELEEWVSILDQDGNLIGRFGSERSNEPGKFWGPHTVWVDSAGDMYIGEVLNGARLQKFARKK